MIKDLISTITIKASISDHTIGDIIEVFYEKDTSLLAVGTISVERNGTSITSGSPLLNSGPLLGRPFQIRYYERREEPYTSTEVIFQNILGLKKQTVYFIPEQSFPYVSKRFRRIIEAPVSNIEIRDISIKVTNITYPTSESANDGSITIEAIGTNSPFKYSKIDPRTLESLDDGYFNGSGTFSGLVPGTHILYAMGTGISNTTTDIASVTIYLDYQLSLLQNTSYNPLVEQIYHDIDGQEYKVELLKLGYVGSPSIDKKTSISPAKIQSRGEGKDVYEQRIISQNVTLELLAESFDEWKEIAEGDERQYAVVKSKKNGENYDRLWTGYCTPSSFSDYLSGGKYFAAISANDRLGDLKYFQFVYGPNDSGYTISGQISQLLMLDICLRKLALGFGYRIACNIFPGSFVEINSWRSVAYGNGVWIAVSGNGTNRVMRSTDDGVTWSTIVEAESNTWQSVAYGNGVWIAVSSDGTNRIMRSTNDGVTWSSVSAAESNGWTSVAYGNGVWIAVAVTGTNRVMRSTNDGVTWSAVAAAEANFWRSVAYGNGVWVSIAFTGTNRVMRSTDDGATWSAVASTELNFWTSVAYGNGVWIAVSQDGTNRIMRSTNDGVSWSAIAAAEANSWTSVAYGNGIWIAVASNGTNRVMRSTDDGASWSAVAAAEASGWQSVAYGNTVWVASAITGTNRIMRSTDNGTSWNLRDKGDSLNQTYVDASIYNQNGNIADCATVVSDILAIYGAMLCSWEGYWYVVRIRDLEQETVNYTEYDYTLSKIGVGSWSPRIEYKHPNLTNKYRWLGGAQSRTFSEIFSKVITSRNLVLKNNTGGLLPPFTEDTKIRDSNGKFIGYEGFTIFGENVGIATSIKRFKRASQNISNKKSREKVGTGTESNPLVLNKNTESTGYWEDVIIPDNPTLIISVEANQDTVTYIESTGYISFEETDQFDLYLKVTSDAYFNNYLGEKFTDYPIYGRLKWSLKINDEWLNIYGEYSSSEVINELFVDQIGSSAELQERYSFNNGTVIDAKYELRIYPVDLSDYDLEVDGGSSLSESEISSALAQVSTVDTNTGRRLIVRGLDDDNIEGYRHFFYELINTSYQEGINYVRPNDYDPTTTKTWRLVSTTDLPRRDRDYKGRYPRENAINAAAIKWITSNQFEAINIDFKPNGEEIPQGPLLDAQNTNANNNLEVVDTLNQFDLDGAFSNSDKLILNYLRDANGDPTRDWSELGGTITKTIQQHKRDWIARMVKRTRAIINGNFIVTNTHLSPINVLFDPTDSNRLYLPIGVTSDDKNRQYTGELIEIGSGDEIGISGFTSGFKKNAFR